jgi:shikimate dehydrogenase
MQSIREDSDIGGANVTIPHKQNVIAYLNDISPHAKAIGAVNTIVKTSGVSALAPRAPNPGGLSGDNTDWIGFLNDLRWHGVEPGTFTHALVLGAGGSARAIVYALASCGLRIQVANRDAVRAAQLVESLRPVFTSISLHASALAAQDLCAINQARPLIVNCTSAGMSPHADTSPWPADAPFPVEGVLYDLVYKPAQTILMRQAQQAGLRVIGGIGMLAEQGAAAFERWTGIPAQRVSAVMRTALAAPTTQP